MYSPFGHKPLQKNYFSIVLDESGSMQMIRREIINSVNRQFDVLKTNSNGMETLVSLVKFSTGVQEPIYWNMPVRKAHPIGRPDYIPDGLTAMLDAFGTTIDRLSDTADVENGDASFIVVVISDGCENNSKRYSWTDVSERVRRLDSTGRWTFAYIGANQDLCQVSRDLSIPAPNVAPFTATSYGMVSAATLLAEATATFLAERRTGAGCSRRFFPSNASDWLVREKNTSSDSAISVR